ncbi:dialkylresorcinol condensing enzyme DarA [Flavobacteriaceae bacterium F89]|uniref:Dialkylresorcinol condensing enzyme DarA n=1 Tax=Cerina litoralis TaxID=2874477 RepID=A0AAE3ETY3_9FLAO|nr:dialkylrecorsinol condensing enzyme DarA [Cerina litoralis]MCG2460189.1 dialkylresorcinol condensing enzyme DarA [Cerina litoralis]
MKEVLVIYYSQTGQLLDILNNITSNFDGEEVRITLHKITPEKDFEFPWTQERFYDAFPESFQQIPTELMSPEDDVMAKKYDLVILGYQVWYLSPSIPINSFLKSDPAKVLLKDTPVITVVACRNMWIMAQEKVKMLLRDLNANLVGHIALVDRHVNNISVITIMHWAFGGKKTKMWGIFPKPGVSDRDIAGARRFSSPINESIGSGDFSDLQEKLLQIGAVDVNPYLIATDIRGNLVFSKWAELISKKGKSDRLKRKKWLVLFKFYLLFAIWVIAPIVYIIYLITYLPSIGKIKRQKKYYSSVELRNI